jgi:hypothetical protein
MAALPEDRPQGAALLDTARRALLDELLPLLPPDKRLDVLMIANAMAIAAREAKAGEGPVREALARIAAIYGERVPATSTLDEASAALARLDRRLVADIRAGAFDAGPKRAAVVDHLRATTRARVAITNPKVLE